MMAMTVWYVPGWMRAQTPERGVLEGLQEIYPEAHVVFKPWNGDDLRCPCAVANADASVGRLVDEIAALPQSTKMKEAFRKVKRAVAGSCSGFSPQAQPWNMV